MIFLSLFAGFLSQTSSRTAVPFAAVNCSLAQFQAFSKSWREGKNQNKDKKINPRTLWPEFVNNITRGQLLLRVARVNLRVFVTNYITENYLNLLNPCSIHQSKSHAIFSSKGYFVKGKCPKQNEF